MAFTEVSNQSWFGRIAGSFKKIIVGGLLFLVSFPLLFWNEGRAVHRAQTLEAGRGAVVENVPNDSIDSSYEGKLVHMVGEALSSETLTDSVFGVSAENAIKLRRVVEMFQWEEDIHHDSKRKLGGGKKTVKTYSYDRVWSEEAIDSSEFHSGGSDEHGENPPMPYQSDLVQAEVVRFGSFKLNEFQVSQISVSEVVPVSESDLDKIANTELAKRLQIYQDGFYDGPEPTQPRVGDLRVRFEFVGPQVASLVAQQDGSSFSAYELSMGTINLFELGEKSADDLFTDAENTNKMILWLVRLGGFVLMAVGIGLVFQPLVVLADVIPFAGSLVGFGVGIISLLVAGIMSFIVIGIAWLFYRPLLAIGLFAVGGVLIFFLAKFFRKKQPELEIGKDGIPMV